MKKNTPTRSVYWNIVNYSRQLLHIGLVTLKGVIVSGLTFSLIVRYHDIYEGRLTQD